MGTTRYRLALILRKEYMNIYGTSEVGKDYESKNGTKWFQKPKNTEGNVDQLKKFCKWKRL